MKKILACLLFVIVLCSSIGTIGFSEDSLQLSEIRDGIFSYSVPSNWIATTSLMNGYNYHYFFAQREGSADGGYIMAFVADLGLGESIPESTLQVAYQSFLEGLFPEGTNYTSESVIICDRPAIVYSGDYNVTGTTEIVHGVSVEANGCVLCVQYLNPLGTLDENTDFFEEIMQTIKISSTPSSASVLDETTQNSRRNPADVGEKIFVTADGNGFTYTMSIQVNDFYRGNDYDKLMAGEYAPEPSVGYEMIAVDVTVTFEKIEAIDVNVAKTDDPKVEVDAISSFESYSSTGMEYDNVHYSVAGQKELTSLYEGASSNGFFQFEVEVNDPAPLLVYTPSWFDDEKIWISLK